MNIAVILAAGKGSRFNSTIPKQLYPVFEKPIIDWSIDVMEKFFSDIIIVTNSRCFPKLKTRHKVVVNDVDNRITSIKSSVDIIKDKSYDNILIHDSARPFVSEDYIEKLLESSKHYSHSQYYLPLVNGLAKKSEGGWKVAPREDFIELCSPQITNFNLFKDIFYKSIVTGKDCEIISSLDSGFNLIEGHHRYLRKITTIEDIY